MYTLRSAVFLRICTLSVQLYSWEFVYSQFSCILKNLYTLSSAVFLRICTLSVQLYSYVTSVNSFICQTKWLKIVITKCFEINELLCFLFCVFFTVFDLIFENMSTNGRKCYLLCYSWHLWRRVKLVDFYVATYCT